MRTGRPTKYDPSINRKVKALCLLGATDAQIASIFDISEATLNTWKKRYPDFLEAIKAGKTLADAKIVESLYKRALGCKVKEVSYEKITDKIFDKNFPVESELAGNELYRMTFKIKELAPDTLAMMYWLNNRARSNWKAKVEDGPGNSEGTDQKIDITLKLGGGPHELPPSSEGN